MDEIPGVPVVGEPATQKVVAEGAQESFGVRIG